MRGLLKAHRTRIGRTSTASHDPLPLYRLLTPMFASKRLLRGLSLMTGSEGWARNHREEARPNPRTVEWSVKDYSGEPKDVDIVPSSTSANVDLTPRDVRRQDWPGGFLIYIGQRITYRVIYSRDSVETLKFGYDPLQDEELSTPSSPSRFGKYSPWLWKR